MKPILKSTSRKDAIRTLFTSLMAGGAALFGASKANARSVYRTEARTGMLEKYPDLDQKQDQVPLFSGATVHDGFVFVAGKGEHDEGDIKVHTEKVLDKIEAELVRAGSSMDKALHVNVYLNNLRDYQGMNEAYRGRFGDHPPARTTVSCYGGVPGNSLVEMDCIAAR
ncbi:MAG: RidA family protein [Balneolaceae bacterium]